MKQNTYVLSCPQLCLILCDPRDCSSPGFSVHGDSPGKNTGVGYHVLFQGIFLTQGLNSRRALQADFLPLSRGSCVCVCVCIHTSPIPPPELKRKYIFILNVTSPRQSFVIVSSYSIIQKTLVNEGEEVSNS